MGVVFREEAEPRTGSPRYLEVYNATDGFLRTKDWSAGTSELLAGCYFFFGPNNIGQDPSFWEFYSENPAIPSSRRSGAGNTVGDKMMNLASGEVWMLEISGNTVAWVLKTTVISLLTDTYGILGTVSALVTAQSLLDELVLLVTEFVLTWKAGVAERSKVIDLSALDPVAPTWVAAGTEASLICRAKAALTDTGLSINNVRWETSGRQITVYYRGANTDLDDHEFKLLFKRKHFQTAQAI